MVTQRLHVDDLVGHLLEQGDWTELSLPAIADVEQVVPLGPDRCHYRKVGELLHPEREPDGPWRISSAPWAQSTLPRSINRSQ